jgi:hypothetical protein
VPVATRIAYRVSLIVCCALRGAKKSARRFLTAKSAKDAKNFMQDFALLAFFAVRFWYSVDTLYEACEDQPGRKQQTVNQFHLPCAR